MTGFSADWLALREPADAAARDLGLAQRFAASLPPRRLKKIIDLGAGTGANARALAPLIAGEQHWFLVESDPALRAAQRQALLAWAARSGFGATEAADMVIERGGARWRFTSVALDLAQDWGALDAPGADAVAASAFFDLASEAWLARLTAWLAARRLPLLATLTVDGCRIWTPPDADDAPIAAAFRVHQGRDKGLGPALGPAAAPLLGRLLAGHDFAIAMAGSDWHLGPAQRGLIEALAGGEAQAARAVAAADGPLIAAWERRRRDAAAASRLRLTVGHRDVLALAPQI
jgi:hypothetical protein